MKVDIPTLMNGKLEIDVVVDSCSLPMIEMVYRVGRQRNWIMLNKEQTDLLVRTLQSKQSQL